MKNTFTLNYKLIAANLLAIFSFTATFAQNQNALAFDGTNDLVTTSSASSPTTTP
jgi:hypothetical protein